MAYYPVYCYTSAFLLFPSTLVLPTILYFFCFRCLFPFTNLSMESISIHPVRIRYLTKCFLILNTLNLCLSTPALLNSLSFRTLFTHFIFSFSSISISEKHLKFCCVCGHASASYSVKLHTENFKIVFLYPRVYTRA